jgi:3-dehydroquinate dehydratase I
MPAPKPVKTRPGKLRIVGVITNSAELRMAGRMSSPPDLFELRLDCLFKEKALERKAAALGAPLIITARHPAEGGKHNLSSQVRFDLLLRFLPLARYVDVELRSVRACRTLIDGAQRIGVNTIISFHNLETTPSLGRLRAKADRAARLRPALFKVATRTDAPAQLVRLLQFISSSPSRRAVSVMGVGKLGAVSRLLLMQCGSCMTYTSLSEPRLEGQLSLATFRRLVRELEVTG